MSKLTNLTILIVAIFISSGCVGNAQPTTTTDKYAKSKTEEVAKKASYKVDNKVDSTVDNTINRVFNKLGL